ncbi:MAG: 2-isopropylmalate synthase [Bacteroidales bacterium]|nr:2-isopropylmalate synthase [Bacteroidales bacterium]
MNFIKILDTTLRDGEQTSGVSFLPHEKLIVAKALVSDLNIPAIEVASARVSAGEQEAVAMICRWASQAGVLDRVSCLGFVDGSSSVDWLSEAGCRKMNLLAKGSKKHCEGQLGKSAAQHISDIKETLSLASAKGIATSLYLEDWSNGIQDSPDYVFEMMDGLKDTDIEVFILPDTLGVLTPDKVSEYIGTMCSRYPSCEFHFHAHNDYDLSVANALAAVKAGAKGVHTCINGLGERAGNAPLASVHATLKDHLGIDTGIREEKLYEVSRLVEGLSAIPIPPNKPVVGDNVFTQVAGVHADGDNKKNLYCNALIPERFGRRREYALGKNSGKASITKNIEDLGLELTPEQIKLVTARIIELGDKKEVVTREDLPYIVNDVLKHAAPDDKVRLVSYMVNKTYGLKPVAQVRLEVNGKVFEESASGDGQYDAFVRCIRHIYKNCLAKEFPWLTNYQVGIPPGGRTDALVQTIITWNYRDKIFHTRGLDADQTEAAIKATIKMLNIINEE